MLINQQLNPGFDLEQVIVTFPAALHPDRLIQSFRAVADRHPVLRSHFKWVDAGPIQVIDEQLIVASPIVDWSANPEVELNRYLDADRVTVMDTTTPPLHRLIMARTNPETWTLVWSFSHALLDGRSVVIVLDDWFALATGQKLGPPPTDFATFAHYVRARESQIDHSFWRQRLDSMRAPTPLPSPFVPPTDVNPRTFGQLRKQLDRTQTAALLAVATAHGATMNHCVQAALAITLGRYAREDHVVFGNVRACRHAPVPGANTQVGLLMNTLPFGVNVAAGQTVGELLTKLRSEQRDQDHHELDNLIAVQANSQVPLGTPLFHTILIFESTDLISALRRRNTEWNHRQVRVISRPSTPLMLEANDGDELNLNFIYDATRWDASFAEQVLTVLITTLTRFITQPQARLAEISLAEPAWLNFLENTYNATQWTHPNLDERLHDLVWAQSLRTPNALALVGGDARLTHQDLCQQAARLARILQERGVSRSTPVGIFAEHGPVGVLSALAIMMAGGTYVPLDPSHPPDRLAWILASAGCQLLITHRGQSSVLNTIPAELIDLDTIDLEHGDSTLPHCPATLEDPAYIIYTSGSTGRPKGVVISHRAVVNTIIDLNDRFVVTATDRVLALSSATFDLSVYDAFGVLAAGGAAIFPVGTALRHPPAWLELMAREKVTMWDTVPALMEMLLPFVDNVSALATLRLAMFSGDWIAVTLPGRLRALAPHCQVFSLGGATEGSIWSILHPTDRLNLRAPSVPYGGPLRNQTMHVLDDALEPCPPLIPGEIAIGGVGVALGYWKDPQRTAERFVTHPRSGKRLYRTGDLGRHLADGTIEFLGRIDHQVKIRGYRVELGEVEAALATHPAVKSCVVAACGDRKVAMRLVAYVVLKPTMTIDLDAIVAHTGKMLAPYMVPEALVTIDALPLSPNGKVDRNRLPAPALIANQNTYTPPIGDTEQRLAELWAKLLGVEKVSANDDFFALGGHSLLAGRLMAQWSHVSPISMELRDVFEARTLRALALHVDQRGAPATPIADMEGGVGSARPLLEVQPGSSTSRPFFFLHGDYLGGGYYCVSLARRIGKEVPFYALVPRHIDPKGPLPTIEELATEHIRHIREVCPTGPYRLGGFCIGGVIAFEIARQLIAQGHAVSLLTLIDAETGYSAERWARRLTRACSFVNDMPPTRQLAMFTRFNQRLERLRQLNPLGLILHGLSRIGLFRPKKPSASHANSMSSRLHTVTSATATAHEQLTAYLWSVCGYHPTRLDITAHLLASDEQAAVTRDPTIGWGPLLTRVEVQRLSGNHLESITRNLPKVAEFLRPLIEDTTAMNNVRNEFAPQANTVTPELTRL
jgi:amino acid adenylation domain-containing protein